MRRILTSVAAAVGIFLCVSAPFASLREPSASRNDQVFRATADSVAVYATVRDRDGRPILGLTQDDFEIFDNGRQRPISVFSNEIQPITIGLLLDRSGSMSARFEAVTQAASAFVDKLGDRDRASLATLNWSCAPTTADKARLQSLLGTSLPNDFGSAIWDGLDRVLGTLTPEPGRRAVLLFSDGLDSGVAVSRSFPTTVDKRTGCTRMPPVSDATRQDIIRRADREGFLIYAISVVTPGTPSGDSDLRSIARDSGGERFRLERDDELKDAFTRIADELHHQYLLGFVPVEFDGKTHEIDVRVKRPGVDVRARRRYVAVRDPKAQPAPVDPAAGAASTAPLGDTEVADAVVQGLAGKRQQATCTTSALNPGATSPTHAEVTIEGPIGRIMRAAREAKAARQPFTSANVTPEMRESVVTVRAQTTQRELFVPPLSSDPLNPTGSTSSSSSIPSGLPPPLSMPVGPLSSVRLRSLSPPIQLLQPLEAPPAPPGFRAPALSSSTRFDLAAFRALPAGDIEAIVGSFGASARCKISTRDRAGVK